MSYNLPQALVCDVPSPDPGDIAGYRFYAGLSSRVYSSGFTTSSTSPNATIAGLLNGNTYFFASTAFDTSNNESTFSNEISKTITVSVLQLIRQVK